MSEIRRKRLSLLAKAPADALARLWSATGLAPDYEWLRPPETGGVMSRGRIGATGAAFNLGEITVTRCALKLASGAVGRGYVQGRDKGQATTAALIDALCEAGEAERLRAEVLEPLSAGIAEAKAKRARRAAETKVDFFTMARGED